MNSRAASFIARIHEQLENMKIEPPKDSSNVAPVLSEAYLWKTIKKYAEAKYDKAMASLKAEFPVDGLAPGNHQLCESQHFVAEASVTEPVRMFDDSTLAQSLLKSKYKVPLAYTKEAVQKAKVPTKSRVTVTITER